MKESTSSNGLLIGAGNIGAMYDFGRSHPKQPLSHLSALIHDPKIERIDVIEPNPIIRTKLTTQPKVRHVMASIDELENLSSHYRIASIATPTPSHMSQLAILQDGKTQVNHVLCEKPLFSNTHAFEDEVAFVKGLRFALSVNFLRNWSNDLSNIPSLITEHDLGEITSGSALYGKGLLNNGSHLINLLIRIFKSTPSVKHVGQCIGISSTGDPSPSFWLDFEGCDVIVLPTSHEYYSIFEIDLLCERGRLTIKDGGRLLEITKPSPDELYSGYSSLSNKTTKVTDLNQAMANGIKQTIQSDSSLNIDEVILTARTYFEVQSLIPQNPLKKGQKYA